MCYRMCNLGVRVWIVLPRRLSSRRPINGLAMRAFPRALSRILVEKVPRASIGFGDEPLLTRSVYNLSRDSATMLPCMEIWLGCVEHSMALHALWLVLSMGELVLRILEKLGRRDSALWNPIGDLPTRGLSVVVPVERLSFVLRSVPARRQMYRRGQLHRRRLCDSCFFRPRPS